MKMSNRHRLSTLKSSKAVSVFLFVFCACAFLLISCGIPTYWQPKNSSVLTKGSSTSNSEVDFTVDVQFYSGDDGANAPKLGLVLLYVCSESTYSSTFETALVKTFNSEYRGTVPNGLSSLTCELNTPLWTFTSNENEYSVYAFTTTSNEAISAPGYNRALAFSSDSSCSVSLQLKSNASGISDVELVVDDTSEGTLGFGLDDLTSLQSSNYIQVYAALSAQGENYSNIYWSNLTYVGEFTGYNSSSSTGE
jgi:hypothetical protein